MAKDPFDLFAIGEQKIAIEAMNGYEITYRPLTMAESDAFNKRLLGKYDGKGDPQIDIAEATKINYEKVALCMIEPKKTVAELATYAVTASKAITEIVKAIDGREDEPEEDTVVDGIDLDTAGNDKKGN